MYASIYGAFTFHFEPSMPFRSRYNTHNDTASSRALRSFVEFGPNLSIMRNTMPAIQCVCYLSATRLHLYRPVNNLLPPSLRLLPSFIPPLRYRPPSGVPTTPLLSSSSFHPCLPFCDPPLPFLFYFPPNRVWLLFGA